MLHDIFKQNIVVDNTFIAVAVLYLALMGIGFYYMAKMVLHSRRVYGKRHLFEFGDVGRKSRKRMLILFAAATALVICLGLIYQVSAYRSQGTMAL